MKKIVLAFGLFVAGICFTQTVPQAFNYQGIARDAQGVSLPNQQLGIKITLQEVNGNTTTNVYAETHNVTTNIAGLFNISIGKGTPNLGTFSGVSFANKNISVKTEIDPTGGTNYTISGTSELLSVPYALVAGNTSTSTPNYWSKDQANNTVYVNTGENVGIGTNIPSAKLDVTGTIKFGSLTNTTTNTKLLSADANGNLSFRDLSTISSLSSPWTKDVTNNYVYVNNGENVGIGTNIPSAKLDVTGTIKFGSLTNTTTNTKLLSADANGNLSFRDLSTISSLSSPWTKDVTNNYVYVNNSEKVGIGTSNPSQTFEIVKNATGNDRALMRLQNTSTANDAIVSLQLISDNNVANGGASLIHHSKNYNSSPGFDDITVLMNTGRGVILNPQKAGSFISFITNGTGFANEKMRIISNGNIGIGTANPTTKLQVTAGDVYLDDPSKGVIMKSPNGTCWRVTVGDTGTLTSTAITCP